MLFAVSGPAGEASVAMASFGENLRREREMRGVSLEEISASTRIGVRFLHALEENDFAALPGGIFTRSFIRAYAAYLGLDQEAVMAEFQTLAPPDDRFDFSRLGTNKPSSGAHRARRPVLLWVVAAALLAGGWALYRYAHREPELGTSPAGGVATPQAPAASVPSSPAPPSGLGAIPATTVPAGPNTPSGSGTTRANTAPGGSAAPSVPSSQTSAVSSPTSAEANPGSTVGRAPVPAETLGAASTPNPAATLPGPAAALPRPASASSHAAQALGEGDLVLQVATTERVWLRVAADGKKVFQQTLDPNTVETFRATDSFDVTTGNAQGTILTLNGETQKPLGRHGELKRLRLTRQDFSNQ